MTPEEIVKSFLDKDMEKCADLTHEYPENIPVKVAAELVGCSQETLRTAIDQFQLVGLSERKAGKQNRAFVIPTAHFLRWYLCLWR